MYRILASGQRLAITQPMHAWVSGQLARAWGEGFRPFESVAHAATLHDLGWIEWERKPRFNPETGWPQTFLETPTSTHLKLWRQGVADALTLGGQETALLVSMHGTGLYHRLSHLKRSAEDQHAVEHFLAEQESFQAELLNAIRSRETNSDTHTPENVLKNQTLIATWDLMSLHLCMNPDQPHELDGVPLLGGSHRLTLRPASNSDCVEVLPWPFRENSVNLTLEARQLSGPYPDERAMQLDLSHAPYQTLAICLVPGH